MAPLQAQPSPQVEQELDLPWARPVLQPPSGHWWLLYNGYRAHGASNRGREMLLDMIHWTRDAWPFFTPGSRPQPTEPGEAGGGAPAQ